MVLGARLECHVLVLGTKMGFLVDNTIRLALAGPFCHLIATPLNYNQAEDDIELLLW